ncbi:peptidylprolyl isomerase [Candidatus Brocadia pituitae]|nr:peptidylprolyl isomerase [Candidatus Brocadia pituitae]
MNRRVASLLCLFLACLQPCICSAEKEQPKSIIVTVNGKPITQEMLVRKLKNITNQNKETFDAMKQEIIDQMITDILIEEFIDKQGLIVTPEEIDREIRQIKNTISGDKKDDVPSLERILSSIGSDIDEFKRSMKYSIALEKYFLKKFDDTALKRYFEENQGVFNGEAVKVSHILIDTRNMKSEKEFAQALEQIKNIKKEIEQGGVFEELARKYSDCPTANNGGDLGFIQRKGNFSKSFLDTAFSLKVGQLSGPVKTEYGYHLIKVTEKKEGSPVRFDDVREKVRLEALDTEILALLNQLRHEATIVFNN